ncbi:MAG: DUF3194 domain-containing protein [Halobacteriales archaeon]
MTVSDEAVVAAAVEAAESVVFSRCDRSDIEDLDVGVSFDDGVLDLDIYLNAPDAEDEGAIADDAALAARAAVDDLLE